MIEHNIIAKNSLESEEIARFVQVLNGYSGSEITIKRDGHRINAKSILGMYALEIKKDHPVHFIISGEDAEQVAEAIDSFFESIA